MPLPMPHDSEMQQDFIGRCMRDPATQDITGDNEEQAHQRQMAACFRQWEDAKKSGPSDLETKSFGALEIKDAEKGEVVAVVATLGVVDKDGDVIVRGAVPQDAAVKMSGYGHDVILDGVAPVGKGIVREEDDQLVFRGRFFMSTERGREAFNTVKELGADGEWSFGYPRGVQTGELTKEWASQGARRIITALTPIEASPVFIGAGVGTGTTMVKAAKPTASVDGVDHPAEDFAYVPDPEKPSTWKLPIFDADHVRNALARLDQTDIPADAMDEVRRKLRAAAEKFNVDAASLDENKALTAVNVEAERIFKRFKRAWR